MRPSPRESYRGVSPKDFNAATAALHAAESSTGVPTNVEAFWIKQQYNEYTEEDHRTWSLLYASRLPAIEKHGSRVYRDGLKNLPIPADRIPRVEELSAYLENLTGWQLRASAGYVPSRAFFAALSQKIFPTAPTIRSIDFLDYLPEPDIFHDSFAHLPLLADPVHAQCLFTFAKLALKASDPEMESLIARVFYFSYEYGLIREKGELKAFGGHLIETPIEMENVLNGPTSTSVELRPFSIENVKAHAAEWKLDEHKPVLFVLESEDALVREVVDLARQMGLEGSI